MIVKKYQEVNESMLKSNFPYKERMDISRVSIESVNSYIVSQSDLSNLLLSLRSSYQHYLLMKLAICTGLKPQEMVNIKSKHLDEKTESIFIPYSPHIQNSQERHIGLENKMFLELLRYTQSMKPEEYIFPGRNGSMSWRSLSYLQFKMRQVLGERFAMKDIQNSYCISLLRNGAHLPDLCYFLGYKNTTTLKKRFRRMFQEEKSRFDLVDSIFLRSA